LSLNGNLEDLPLLDILQIVSFSKKTGFLSIRASAGEGAIVFDDGFVVASFNWETVPLDPRIRTLAPEKRASLLRQRIEMSIEQLIRLREGQFSFSLTDKVPQAVGGRDIREEALAHGINAQELLLDLARGLDEDRRDSTAALEASFAEVPEAPEAPEAEVEIVESDAGGPEPAVPDPGEVLAPDPAPPPPPEARAGAPAPAVPSAEEPRTILLVDDEEEVRRILAELFTRGGYQVVEAEDTDAAAKKANRLGKAGIPFLLVIDLGMPTSGGTSFQGGFEVVKRLWKMNLRPNVLLMTDSFNAAIQARARQMGIQNFIFKPGLSKLDPEQFEADLRAFATKILRDLLPRLDGGGAEAAPHVPKPAAASRAAAPAPAPPPSPEELSREFAMLQRRLEELRRPQDPSQISALVMRVAREFFERAILFVVKNEHARGLGGFGAAPREEKLGLIVREVAITLDEPSVFSRVAFERRPYLGEIPDDRWTGLLFGKIGKFRASTMALLPLLTNRETIALLYGDNPESGQAPSRLQGLEVFINQAGIALENAFLQRKVHALQTPE
jgi:CheY-like chemotaxis protein